MSKLLKVKRQGPTQFSMIVQRTDGRKEEMFYERQNDGAFIQVGLEDVR